MFTLKFLVSAKKDLSKIDPIWQRRIKKKLELLARNPLTLKNSIKPLKGKAYKGMAWLRVGNYRIIFQKKEKKLIIVIIRIANRSGIYRN